jgi:hypothetical protein
MIDPSSRVEIGFDAQFGWPSAFFVTVYEMHNTRRRESRSDAVRRRPKTYVDRTSVTMNEH